MSNIVITNKCNLNCQYCFEKTSSDYVFKEEDMEIDTLKNIINFIMKSERQIGIMGGEPSLHNNFEEVIETLNYYSRAHQIIFTLLTNGANIYNYLDMMDNFIHLLININDPKTVSKSYFNNVTKIFEKQNNAINSNLKNRMLIGCNIYPTLLNYDYIWDIMNEYNFTNIRAAVVIPKNELVKYQNNKHEYFSLMKNIFINFINEADKRDYTVGLDCTRIPSCYFSKEEIKLIRKVCFRGSTESLDMLCVDNPVIDFISEDKIYSCFGSRDILDISDKNFNDTIELKRYVSFKYLYPKILNDDSKCSLCKKKTFLQCQGGCLGFIS